MEDNNKISSADIREIGYHLSGNKEKYFNRFEKIEDGKITFNFSSGIFLNLWLAYQFLFPEWFIISIIDISIDFGLTLWTAYCDLDYVHAVIRGRLILYSYWLLKFIFFGFFGDRLLFRSIKKRVENNRKGKCGIRTMMTATDKTIVFRGFSVFVCAIYMLLSVQVLQAVIDWIIY